MEAFDFAKEGCKCCAFRGLCETAADEPQHTSGEHFGRFFVLRGARAVYTLENEDLSASTVDVWVGGGKILALTQSEESFCPNFPVKVIDVSGLTIVPGFVDCHVHVTGGGGEAGFASRTPEAQLVNAGVTTFVGLLGTDCVTRSTENLIAKTRGLSASGLTGYCLLGGYQFPPVNDVTGSISRDVMLLPEALGVGEIAISDHRSSSPSTLELTRLAQDVRTAGLLSGKAGITYFHLGDYETAIQPLWDVVKSSALPMDSLVPTHMERTPKLIEEGAKWVREGGHLDFSGFAEGQREAITRYFLEGVPMLDKVSISSDSYGSMPIFDAEGRLAKYDYVRPDKLLATFAAMVFEDNIPVGSALSFFTRNPASMLRLRSGERAKGVIRVGGDADLLVLNLPQELPANHDYTSVGDMRWPNIDSMGMLQYVIASGRVLRCPISEAWEEEGEGGGKSWTSRGMFETA